MPPSIEKVVRAERLRSAYGGHLDLLISKNISLRVVHLSGTPKQMGRQYGALLGDSIRELADATVTLFTQAGLPASAARRVLDTCWNAMRPHVPRHFMDEMAGIAEGASENGVELSETDVHRILAGTNLDMFRREERLAGMVGEELDDFLDGLSELPALSCTFFAAWGPRTVDGKLFAARNLDWFSQTGMHGSRLLTVYRPAGGNAFVTVGYTGLVGALAGMNEHGVCISQIGAHSTAEELDGIPWTLLMRQVLEESDSREDAAGIVESASHTLGYNFLVADGDPGAFGSSAFAPGAVAFETNHDACERFVDDDPRERAAAWRDGEGNEHHVGLARPHWIARADTAFGASTRAMQAADNGPGVAEQSGDPRVGGLASSYVACHQPMAAMADAYAGGTAYVFPVRGNEVIAADAPRLIGAEEALNIAATVAHNTERLAENDWNVMSVVYAATDMEIFVAFESENNGVWKNAPDTGYLHLSVAELLADEY